MSNEWKPDDVVFVSVTIPISRALAEELCDDGVLMAFEARVADELVRKVSAEMLAEQIKGSGQPVK